jgi:hypothetical protein
MAKSSSFPLPVIGNMNDYKTYTLGLEVGVGPKLFNNTVDFSINYGLTSLGDLEEKLWDNTLSLYLEVRCANTLSRQLRRLNFQEKEVTQNYILEPNSVCGEVIFQLFLQADEDIDEFSSHDFSSLFNGIKFKVPKGSLLGFSEELAFSIPLTRVDLLGRPPSIVRISEALDERDIPYIDWDAERINLLLPQDDYKIFQEAKQILDEQAILAIYVQSIITEASMKCEDENYRQYRWAQTIRKYKEQSNLSGFDFTCHALDNVSMKAVSSILDVIDQKMVEAMQ